MQVQILTQGMRVHSRPRNSPQYQKASKMLLCISKHRSKYFIKKKKKKNRPKYNSGYQHHDSSTQKKIMYKFQFIMDAMITGKKSTHNEENSDPSSYHLSENGIGSKAPLTNIPCFQVPNDCHTYEVGSFPLLLEMSPHFHPRLQKTILPSKCPCLI